MSTAVFMSKKTVDKLGTRMNDLNASKPSAFALRQMEKMGWTEGKGLGKNEDGISNSIKIHKREDNQGLGADVEKAADSLAPDGWWHDAFAQSLKSLTAKIGRKSRSKESKKRKASSDSFNSENDGNAPTFQELFVATGGARLGMRARADQKGKFRRTEENYKSESSTTIVTKSETITTVTNSFANTSVVTPKMDSQVVKNDETVDENSDRSGKMDRKEEVVAETVTVIEKKKRNKAKKERKEKKEKKEKKRDKTKSK